MSIFFMALRADKIKIDRNINPIRMELFLSFLTVNVVRETDFLGCDTGWTRLSGINGLVVRGGVVGGVEYLDGLNYGKNLANPYNNYVNPFYLFDILNEAGRKFFLKYYSKDIRAVMCTAEAEIKQARMKIKSAIEYKKSLFSFWEDKGYTHQ